MEDKFPTLRPVPQQRAGKAQHEGRADRLRQLWVAPPPPPPPPPAKFFKLDQITPLSFGEANLRPPADELRDRCFFDYEVYKNTGKELGAALREFEAQHKPKFIAELRESIDRIKQALPERSESILLNSIEI